MNTGPGALNRFYRLIWNETTHAFIPVAETARTRRKHGGGIAGALVTGAVLLHAGCACAAAPPAPPPNTLPTGGRVSIGAATIAHSGNTLNIAQSTPQASLTWTSFDIGASSQVNFLQPTTSSVAFNRVVSADPSAGYTFAAASGTGSLTVTPAPLTITANNLTKLFGQPNPTLTFVVAGLQSGDTVADITGITVSVAGGPSPGVGEHVIGVSGGTDPNYTIVDINGTPTVQGGPPESDSLLSDVTRTIASAETPIAALAATATRQGSLAGVPGQLVILDDALCGSGGNTHSGSTCAVGTDVDGHGDAP
jgi:MBG domain (YGX type)/Extended Signal Peptide of Type V secretion system